MVYLPRTANISSTKLRQENSGIRLGIIGYEPMVEKIYSGIQVCRKCRAVGDFSAANKARTIVRWFVIT